MGIFEIILIIGIPLGTFLLNKWRAKLTGAPKLHRAMYSLVSIIMSASPMISIHSFDPNHTALGVVLAAIAFFWFAIVGSRISLVSQSDTT